MMYILLSVDLLIDVCNFIFSTIINHPHFFGPISELEIQKTVDNFMIHQFYIMCFLREQKRLFLFEILRNF